MTKKLLLFACALISTMLSSQTAFEDWKTLAGTQNFYYRTVMKVDPYGNTIVAGATMANGMPDILVAKYNTYGVQLWIQQFSGSAANQTDFAAGLYVTDNYIYLTGAITNNTLAPETDVVTMKLSPSTGSIVWSSTYSGPAGSLDVGKHIIVDGANNVYVTGASYNASYNTDYLTLCYNSSGVQQWVSQWDYLGADDAAIKVALNASKVMVSGAVTTATANVYKVATLSLSQSTGSLIATSISTAVTTTSVDVVTDLTTDAAGNILIAGSMTNAGQNDIYVQKLAGNTLLSSWIYTYDGVSSLSDIAKAIACDASNNVYVTGFSTSSTNGKEIILIKLNSSGVNQFTQLSGFGGNDEANDVVIDASSNAYITGYRTTSTELQNYYTAKYSTSGTKLWEIEADGHYLNDYATNMALDSLNNVIITGQSESSPGNFEFLTVRYVQKEIQVPIEASPENPNPSYLFFENKGQILNSAGTAVANGITHVVMDATPIVYLQSTTLSYKLHNLDTLSSVDDTIQRIDIALKNSNESSKGYSMEKTQGVINLFDEKLLSTITDIQGFSRVVVPDAYTGIDVHYYSNSKGLKIYYMVKPGADPRNIQWSINGANTTSVVGTNLEIQGMNDKIIYDQPNFYQTNLAGTSTSSLAAGTWTNVGTDQYKFDIPVYNNALPLVIEVDYGNTVNSSPTAIGNLEFCTFYGGSLDEQFKAMKVNTVNGNYVVVGNTKSYDANREFPTAGPGTSQIPATGAPGTYMTVVMFDSIGRRLCTNIYGSGTNDFVASDLVINDVTQAVTIVGNTFNTTLPTPNALNAGVYSNNSGQGFVVQFERSGPSLNQIKWSSRLNGYASGIGIKPNTKEIYITSATKSTSFAADLMTKTNAYNQTMSSSKWHFQVSKFDGFGVRKWATYFPAYSTNPNVSDITNSYYNNSNGIYNEGYLKCHIDCDNYGFTIAGEARDTGLVIFNKYHRAIDSTFNGGSSDAFVTRFNSNDSIVFSRYIGGAKKDGYHDLKYSNPNEIVLAGYSQSVEYKNLTFRANSNQYIDTLMPTNATKMLISKIDSTGQTIWSTFYGNGNSDANQSCLGWSITNDNEGKIFVTGVTSISNFRIATSNAVGVMNNITDLNFASPTVPGYADAFMLCLSTNNQVGWNTYFGGSQNDCGLGLEYNVPKNRVMITGFTNTGNAGSSWAKKFPTTYTTFNASVWYKDALNASNGSSQIYSGYDDGFIGWFRNTNIVGINEYFNDNTIVDAFNLYPNPTDGDSYIAFKNKLEGQVLIEIYSITGQLMYSNSKNSIFDRTVIALPTNILSSGMYIVNVKNEDNSFSKKLIISK